ncbi:hypothetical protein [Streptomyces triticiradicis]|uniref:Type IV toxin-antitoxin system AbiEi family antitoxin domain-containing protein n=1 Tax=Streptomyces triticiradicis TaxID=2651189 RepID=A0A7J5DC16_9ACTN|nr:hypothetical protein [Streptomyces triticiradicis]KAB1986165.1 hypothetical protein F8144_23965 [Streptomyces triticiradicis]
MNHSTPLSIRTLHHPSPVQHRVLTAAQLRDHGVTAADADERCRPGGPWQRILPGVFLLHPGPPTPEERLHAALLYTARPPSSRPAPRVPAQPGSAGPPAPRPSADALITGLAALALHGFSCAPPLPSLDTIDVLVPRMRRLRSTGCVRIVRTTVLPAPVFVAGLPVAAVPRALADAVAELTDGETVRGLLTEAVRRGLCEPRSVVEELTAAQLLDRPHVIDAVDSLVAEGRAIAESRLYRMVFDHGLPAPVWNVGLRLPGGPHLGGVDAYWPEQAVAVELDTRPLLRGAEAGRSEQARRRERLERLGITVVHIAPRRLRDAMEEQATIVRTALMAASDRDPAAYVLVLPR